MHTIMIKSFSLVYGGVAQLARAPALQAGGHRFDSVHLHHKVPFVGTFFILSLSG